jgi:hypothetical protein
MVKRAVLMKKRAVLPEGFAVLLDLLGMTIKGPTRARPSLPK